MVKRGYAYLGPFRCKVQKVNSKLLGDGECVALVKESCPGLKDVGTWDWRPGRKVMGNSDIPYGTAVATFVNGVYPPSGAIEPNGTLQRKHAAIFLQQRSMGVLVSDQWPSRGNEGVSERVLSNYRGDRSRSNHSLDLYEILIRKRR